MDGFSCCTFKEGNFVKTPLVEKLFRCSFLLVAVSIGEARVLPNTQNHHTRVTIIII